MVSLYKIASRHDDATVGAERTRVARRQSSCDRMIARLAPVNAERRIALSYASHRQSGSRSTQPTQL
jgi:hypothetical protein